MPISYAVLLCVPCGRDSRCECPSLTFGPHFRSTRGAPSHDHVNLVPWDEDTSEEKFASSFLVGFPVIVSDKAKGPVTLTGGTWTAAGKAATPAVAKRKAATTLPEGARSLTKEEIAELDVDASDNNDAFVAIVGGKAGGGAGGGEDDPSLPVTGPVAASAAGAGVLALGVGAFLFFSTRRRRISFAAPSDNE